MIERLLESRDPENYTYESSKANINEYGFFANLVENNWIRISNWSDYYVRILGLVIYNIKEIFGLSHH